MTAKEKLLQRVQTLSEDEAAETLRLLDQRAEDPVLAAFGAAPLDDEPWTEQDEQAAAEGRADVAAGRTVSLEDAMPTSGERAGLAGRADPHRPARPQTS